MKTSRNRTMYLVLALSIVVVGAALAFGSQLGQTTEVSVNSSATELQKPEWKVGGWWVVGGGSVAGVLMRTCASVAF